MADEGYITQARRRRGQGEADRHARAAQPAAGHRAVLRRGDPQAPRTAIRREGAVRERPLGHDDARREDCRRPPTARSKPGLRRLRQAPRLAPAGAERDRRASRPSTASRTTAGTGRSRPATSCPPSSSPRRRPAPRGCGSARYHGRSGAGRLRLDPADVRRRPVQAGRSRSTSASRRSTRRARTASVALEQTPLAEARARGHRQPHRPDSRDGRRLELRPQQVQPRGAGVPPARIDVQADRLHDGHRSRLHARVHPHRRAGRATRPGPASRSTARRTTTTSTKGRSPCAMRSRSRATFRPSR